jgi:hypothetical protein
MFVCQGGVWDACYTLAMRPNINDPKFKELAADILHRHSSNGAAFSITGMICDFLIETELAQERAIFRQALTESPCHQILN